MFMNIVYKWIKILLLCHLFEFIYWGLIKPTVFIMTSGAAVSLDGNDM